MLRSRRYERVKKRGIKGEKRKRRRKECRKGGISLHRSVKTASGDAVASQRFLEVGEHLDYCLVIASRPLLLSPVEK